MSKEKLLKRIQQLEEENRQLKEEMASRSVQRLRNEIDKTDKAFNFVVPAMLFIACGFICWAMWQSACM